LEAQLYFSEPWHYDIATLFVFQSYVARNLPAVFYLYFGGPFGSGKTNSLDLIRRLTGGTLLENVSIPALARIMGDAQTICLDEIDVSRGGDFDEVRGALLRQGYHSSAAPYTRWNLKQNLLDTFPIYGPKAAAYRSFLEDGLQSRGFLIPTIRAPGEGNYDLVLHGLWPPVSDLRPRLLRWQTDVSAKWSSEQLRDLASSGPFKAKVQGVLPGIGGNRDTELIIIAVLVAEVVGVDLTSQLSECGRAREVAMLDARSPDLDDLRDILVGLAVRASGPPTVGGSPLTTVTVRQQEIKHDLDAIRAFRNVRPISAKDLARLRRELGVKDAWLSKSHSAAIWNLPIGWVMSLGAEQPSLAQIGSPASPTSPVSPDRQWPFGSATPTEGEGSQGSSGRLGSQPGDGTSTSGGDASGTGTVTPKVDL